MLRRLIAAATVVPLLVCVFAAAAQTGADGCKVLDPELQGTYVGGCVSGGAALPAPVPPDSPPEFM